MLVCHGKDSMVEGTFGKVMHQFCNDRATLYCGDNRIVLKDIPDNTFDSIVTDPPYALNFMGKGWDTGGVTNDPEFWKECLRVLKPGGHIAAFGGSRTYHRMTCAIEDAGFEIRDSLMWIYGSGFPKSLDVSKSIDKAAGAEREVVGRRTDADKLKFGGKHDGWDRPWMHDPEAVERCQAITTPSTDAAREWEGWGTALKPAFEPIVLARKPLSEKTVAANVLRWGTGALNIGACRIGTEGGTKGCDAGPSNGILGDGLNGSFGKPVPGLGRWPANVVHDGSDEVVGSFPNNKDGEIRNQIYGSYRKPKGVDVGYGGSGSVARFFYSSKASKADRAGSKHPTVKPISLMEWLIKLITPPDGHVLDPFAGSGTTGQAAINCDFKVSMIELEVEYQEDIERRMNLISMLEFEE